MRQFIFVSSRKAITSTGGDINHILRCDRGPFITLTHYANRFVGYILFDTAEHTFTFCHNCHRFQRRRPLKKDTLKEQNRLNTSTLIVIT